MFKKTTFIAVFFNIALISACFAGFGGFDHEDIATQPVTHGGALLVKKYPANHPDGYGEQLCIFLGHDRNFNSWQPAAGSVDPAQDFDIRGGRRFYSSLKTIKREVLEETGGRVVLTDDILRNSPLFYSRRFHDLLAVVRDDDLSVQDLNHATQQAIADPLRAPAWKEMDAYDAFPMTDVINVAQIMRTHFEGGGTVNNLPPAILSPRRSNGLNTPLVYVSTRSRGRAEVCAYYMGAIADTLPQLQQIIQKEERDRLAAVQRQREEKDRLAAVQRQREEKDRLATVQRRQQEEKNRLVAAQRQREEKDLLAAVQRQREELQKKKTLFTSMTNSMTPYKRSALGPQGNTSSFASMKRGFTFNNRSRFSLQKRSSVVRSMTKSVTPYKRSALGPQGNTSSFASMKRGFTFNNRSRVGLQTRHSAFTSKSGIFKSRVATPKLKSHKFPFFSQAKTLWQK